MAILLDLTTANIDIVDHIGNTICINLDYRTAKAPNGVQIDLTGYTARMMVRQAEDSTIPLIELSSPSAGIVLNDLDFNIKVTILPSQTLLLTPDTYYYDLELRDSLGKIDTFSYGKLKLLPVVTR